MLVDPVFATRLVVLRRQRWPGLALKELPAIDVVLITHAHMDHLNLPSLRRVVSAAKRLRGDGSGGCGAARGGGLGGAAGVWGGAWDGVVGGASGAGVASDDDSLQALGRADVQGYAQRVWRVLRVGWGARVYHSGDTAYFEGFKEIGRRLRPDVALLPIGAYFPDSYRAVHTSPEEAVRGFVETGAGLMVPMHFGTFRLGREPMDEPVERLRLEALRLGIEKRVRVLAEGETLRLGAGPDGQRVEEMRLSA